MALSHFKAKHFGAKSLITLGSLIGGIVAVVAEWIIRARRRQRR